MMRMRILSVSAVHARRALTAPAPTAIPAPPDVAAPPADAAKTASGLATKVIKPGNRQGPSGQRRPRDGPLHRLDDRRQDVRQLGRARQAVDFPRQPRDRRVERRPAADGAGEKRGGSGFRKRSPTKDRKAPKGMLVFDVELARHAEPRADRRQSAAGGREEDRERAGLQGSEEGHRRAPSEGRAAR